MSNGDYDLDELMEEMDDSESDEEKRRKRSRYQDKDVWVGMRETRAIGDLGEPSTTHEDEYEHRIQAHIAKNIRDRGDRGDALEPEIGKRGRELFSGITSSAGKIISGTAGMAAGVRKKWKEAGDIDINKRLRAKDPMSYELMKAIRSTEQAIHSETDEKRKAVLEDRRARLIEKMAEGWAKRPAGGSAQQEDYRASAANLRAQAALSAARLQQMQGGRAPVRAVSPVSISAAPGATSYWDTLRLGPGQPVQLTPAHLQQRDFWSQLSGDSQSTTANYWRSLNMGMGPSQAGQPSNALPASYFAQLGLGPSVAPPPPPRFQPRAYRPRARTKTYRPYTSARAPRSPPRRSLKKWVDWKKKASKKTWKKKSWKKKPWQKKTWKPRKKWTKWRRY